MKQDSFRLTVIGAGGVGKSAIVVRYLTNRFIGNYTSSEEDSIYRQTVELPNLKQLVKLEICDGSSSANRTSDDEANPERLSDKKILTSNGVVIVYSILDESSFEHAKSAARRILSRRPSLPLLLLGNKRDMEHDRKVLEVRAGEVTTRGLPSPAMYEEVSAADDVEVITKVIGEFVEKAVGSSSMSISVRSRSKAKRRPSLAHMAKAILKVTRKSSNERVEQEGIH